jgi:hypothetical protein
MLAAFARLFSRRTRPIRKPARRPRLCVESLEVREVPSATPFSLAGGNLYNTAISQQQPIDTNVRSYVVSGDGSMFDVHLDGSANYLRPSGSLTPLDSSVQTLTVGPDGTLYDLETSGQLLSRTWAAGWRPIDTNVRSFVVSGDGSMFDVRNNGDANYVRSGGPLTPLDSSVQTLAVGPDGTLYDLETTGQLYSRTWGAGWKPIDTNVRSFVVSADGSLFDVRNSGDANYLRPGGALTPLAGGVQALAVGPDGTLFMQASGLLYSRTWNAGWKQIDSGVTGFGLAADGTLFEQEADGSLHTWALAAGLKAMTGGVALDTQGDLYRWNAQTPGSPALIDTGVQKYTIAGGKIYDLHTDNCLAVMNPDGSARGALDTGVTKWAVNVSGDAYTLDVAGHLYRDGAPTVAAKVTAFALDAAGNYFALDASNNLSVNGVFSSTAQGLYQGSDPSGNPVAYLFSAGALWQFSAGAWAYLGGTDRVVQGCGQLLCTSGSGSSFSVWTPTGLVGGTQSFAFLSVNDSGTHPIGGLYQGLDSSGNPVAYLYKDGALWQFTGSSHYQYVGSYQRTTDSCWAYLGGTDRVVQGCGQLLCTSGSGTSFSVWTPTGVVSGVASFEFLADNAQGLYQGHDQAGNPVAYLLQGGTPSQFTGVNFGHFWTAPNGYHYTTDKCWQTFASDALSATYGGDGKFYILHSNGDVSLSSFSATTPVTSLPPQAPANYTGYTYKIHLVIHLPSGGTSAVDREFVVNAANDDQAYQAGRPVIDAYKAVLTGAGLATSFEVTDSVWSHKPPAPPPPPPAPTSYVYKVTMIAYGPWNGRTIEYARYVYSFTDPSAADAVQYMNQMSAAWAQELNNFDDPAGRWTLSVPVYDEGYQNAIGYTYTTTPVN